MNALFLNSWSCARLEVDIGARHDESAVAKLDCVGLVALCRLSGIKNSESPYFESNRTETNTRTCHNASPRHSIRVQLYSSILEGSRTVIRACYSGYKM